MFILLGFVLLIIYLEVRAMPQLQAITDAVDALTTSISNEIARVTTALSSPTVDPTEIATIVASLTALKAQIDAFDPAKPTT